MSKWVYIAGRGHSGSTLLDGMLGNAASVESVGELVSGINKPNSICSCGVPLSKCLFWNNVKDRTKETIIFDWNYAVESIVKQSHIKYFFKTLFSNGDFQWIKDLKNSNTVILNAIAKNDIEVVVDSSKELTRALFLLRYLPETKIIHLVRHPSSILESHYSRLKSGEGFRFLRKRYKSKYLIPFFLFTSTIGWIIGNSLVELFSLFSRKNVLLVKYEDLIDNTEDTINMIGDFIETDLNDIIRKISRSQFFYIKHNIGGNKMRMNEKFKFNPKRSKNYILPKAYSIMTNLVCYPLLKYYRY